MLGVGVVLNLGMDNVRQGKARKGKERQGKARKGKERQGKARKGKERQGKARKGKERQGKARQGYSLNLLEYKCEICKHANGNWLWSKY
jgi:hypothetical protein